MPLPETKHHSRDLSYLAAELASPALDDLVGALAGAAVPGDADKHPPPAVRAAVTPTPATASAKKVTAAAAIAEVSVIAKESPRLLASILASVNFAVVSIGPLTARSANAMIRSVEPGATLSYPARSAGAGSGALQAAYPTTSREDVTDWGNCSLPG